MAARRSRLQIKPNIGGPKGPAIKPATNKKTAIQVTTPVEPVKQTTPTPAAAAASSQELVDKSLDLPTVKTSSNTEPAETLKDVDKEANTEIAKSPAKEVSSDKDNNNTGDKNDTLTSPPTRARIRRFGKVNLAAIKTDKTKDDTITSKSPVHQQKTDSVSDTSDNQTDNKDSPKTSVAGKAPESAVVEAKSPVKPTVTTSIPRRSRFPKAKPNIADASKRKQRPEEKGEDSPKGSNSTSSKKVASVPSIVVTPSEEPMDAEETTSSATADNPDGGGHMTQIQARPPAPRSPMKVPVRPPISVSPDKRQRTVSVSEAPAPKRPKKPKVDAPTDKPPDRSTMRMRDLIHWNPRSNPMKPKVKPTTDEVVVGAVEKENVVKDPVTPVNNKAPPPPATPPVTAATPPPVAMEISEDSNSSMPVPQLTIGPDGNIVINEKSLVVANPDAEKGSADEDGIIDETDMITTYHSFRKLHKSKKWSKRETAKFYKALAMIGIDFTMIEKLFPKRNRQDIKKKFKIEERKNKSLVDKILTESIRFDPAIFEATEEELQSSSEDEEEKQKKAKKEKKPGRKKKEKDPTDEPPKPRKKPTKRKKKPLNYFEDSHSENEDTEEPRNTAAVSEDTPWQPACVSGKDKDGEVVGILMDMSEGRLSTDGTPVSANNPAQPGAPGPARTNVIPGLQNIITLQTKKGPRNIAPRPAVTGEATRVQLNTNSLLRPGISALASQNVQSAITNTLNSSSVTGAGNTRVVLNNMPSGALRTSPVLESNQHIVTEHVASEVGTSQNALPPGVLVENQSVYPPVQGETTTYADDSVIQSPPDNVQIPEGQEEQYVLVTVVPEGGEETVIHIYKLHGGAMTQDSVEGFAQNLNVSLSGAGGSGAGGTTEVTQVENA